MSYAVRAALIGGRARFVPAAEGEGGGCDPDALGHAARTAAAEGRPIRSVMVTLPDNPTGRLVLPWIADALDAIEALLADLSP